MEGFVFDLQRFANWTDILNSDDDNNEYYFEVNDDSEYLTIKDYSAGTTSNPADDTVRVLVQRTGSSGYRVNLVQCAHAGAISYSNSSSRTLQLNFDGVNSNKTFKFSVKKLECLNLQGTVQEGNDGFDVITASVKNSGSVTFETPDKTVKIKGESTGTVIYGGMAYNSLNTIYILADASVGTVNFGSDSGRTLNLAAGASVGNLEGSGSGTINLAAGATVSYVRKSNNVTTTSTLEGGQKVTVSAMLWGILLTLI